MFGFQSSADNSNVEKYGPSLVRLDSGAPGQIKTRVSWIEQVGFRSRLVQSRIQIQMRSNNNKYLGAGDGVDAALPRRHRNVPSLRC